MDKGTIMVVVVVVVVLVLASTILQKTIVRTPAWHSSRWRTIYGVLRIFLVRAIDLSRNYCLILDIYTRYVAVSDRHTHSHTKQLL